MPRPRFVLEPSVILASAFGLAIREDGWLHFVQDGHNLVRGPLGVVLYLVFAPLYWMVPRSGRAPFLILTSLGFALMTLGHSYALTMLALALAALIVVRYLGRRGRLAIGTVLLLVVYAALIIWPQPEWLPRIPDTEPWYFYLHWAGIGYLFLKSYHVLADVAAGKAQQPQTADFLAYLLFAPTLRMGPIYRYPEFATQMDNGPSQHRSVPIALIRLFTGLVRLGVMAALIAHFPGRRLYDHPETLDGAQILVHMYAAAMAIYLWISAYVDFSIAVGRVVGFKIPENFDYPWVAANIGDFWRRWHITLSFWLRDYVFTPLIRRRWPATLSFMATFVLCGLWHGTYLSYMLWGLSQGVALGLRRSWDHYWKRRREQQWPVYAGLERLGLVRSRFNTILCWLVSFHFQILTINLFLDESHALRLLARRVFCSVG